MYRKVPERHGPSAQPPRKSFGGKGEVAGRKCRNQACFRSTRACIQRVKKQMHKSLCSLCKKHSGRVLLCNSCTRNARTQKILPRMCNDTPVIVTMLLVHSCHNQQEPGEERRQNREVAPHLQCQKTRTTGRRGCFMAADHHYTRGCSCCTDYGIRSRPHILGRLPILH